MMKIMVMFEELVMIRKKGVIQKVQRPVMMMVMMIMLTMMMIVKMMKMVMV